jgi:hypothetical protein
MIKVENLIKDLSINEVEDLMKELAEEFVYGYGDMFLGLDGDLRRGEIHFRSTAVWPCAGFVIDVEANSETNAANNQQVMSEWTRPGWITTAATHKLSDGLWATQLNCYPDSD